MTQFLSFDKLFFYLLSLHSVVLPYVISLEQVTLCPTQKHMYCKHLFDSEFGGDETSILKSPFQYHKRSMGLGSLGMNVAYSM